MHSPIVWAMDIDIYEEIFALVQTREGHTELAFESTSNFAFTGVVRLGMSSIEFDIISTGYSYV